MCGYHLNIDTGTPKRVEVISPQGTQVSEHEGESIAALITEAGQVIETDINEWGCDESSSVY